MNPQTEQLLGTLELLRNNPFVWENSIKGKLCLWNLMISQGFVNLTDLELAFAHWQNIEEWGTPTNQAENDYEYAPTRSKRKNDNWDEIIAKERKNYYQQLLQLITNKLQNIQAYNLSIPKTNHLNFEFGGQLDFSVSIVVAQTSATSWLCFAPTVPNQVDYYGRTKKNSTKEQTIIQSVELGSETKQITAKIQPILDKITPILIYEYYHGGYNGTYQHRIVSAIAETKESAIALALQNTEMVAIEKTTVGFPGERNPQLDQFMNTCLRDRTIYDLSFWDMGYTYDLGQTPTGDWIGTRYQKEFEYNP